MQIKVLAENTSISKNYKYEHGLSLFIQTSKNNILFDMGQGNLFLENAKKLNVDLSMVNIALISHGHYDHGGGLRQFLDINNHAKIYAHTKIFEDYFSKQLSGQMKYIGLDKSLKENNRIRYINDYFQIDDELEIFSKVVRKELNPYHNNALFMQKEGATIEDTFEHEQNLIINTQGKSILIAGCAHSGIVNIIAKYYNMKADYPDYVIGGFHLYNNSSGESEREERVQEIARKLNNGKTIFYTGHCTGEKAFPIMKNIMKGKINKLSTGQVIQI